MSALNKTTDWPDPDKPGVPLNPEVDGFHWLGNAAFVWVAKFGNWGLNGVGFPPEFFANTSYHGPALTPTEVDAIKADLTHWQEVSYAFEFDLQSARAENARLREAASEYMRAMEGFASAVREDAGLAYPWPAQEITRAKIRAALEVKS